MKMLRPLQTRNSTTLVFLVQALVCTLSALTSPARGSDSAASAKDALVLDDENPCLVEPTLDLRARYEYGDQEGLAASHAGTLRSRIGLLTRETGGIQAFAEYEGTRAIDRNSYRAAAVHGPAAKTVIADPESDELNQLWISWTAPAEELSVKAGRQAINLDNQRYVGGVAWRQNMQTYDAAVLAWSPVEDFEFTYGYVSQVNRIFGSDAWAPPITDFKGNSHLLNAKWKNTPLGTVTAYVYSLDLHNFAGDGASNNSFGLSLAGPLGGSDFDYYAELAHQTDAHDNPNDYGATYAHGNLSTALAGNLKGTLGLEYLGSDNGTGYQFPLGTNHKFNGFADRFLGTPPGGLADLYVSVSTGLGDGAKLAAFYHCFHDDGFDNGLGHEADLVVSKDLGHGLTLLGKGAYFWGQGGFPDTARASVELNFAY